MDNENDFKKLLNATGFAFQLAVEEAIRVSQAEHNWEVVAREHPWTHEPTGANGYIDIVLEKRSYRLVLECKRTSDAKWLFLVPETEDEESIKFRSLWCHVSGNSESLVGWAEFQVLPGSPESQFCNIRGSGEGKTTLLERLASELIRSVEGLASEEGQIASMRTYFPHIYIPTIVTNAELVIGTVDPTSVPLDTGKLDDATFRRVDYLRFRKALDTGPLTHQNRLGTVRESNWKYQRSILIVNAKFLCKLLSRVDIKKLDEFEAWPWEPSLNRHR